MASNFEISVHRENGGPSLDLIGDFDGTSAGKLLNSLAEICQSPVKVSSRPVAHTELLADLPLQGPREGG